MENVLLLRFGFFCKEIQLQLFLEYGNGNILGIWDMAAGMQPYQGETYFANAILKKSVSYTFFYLKANLPLETSYLPLVRLNTLTA